MNAVKADTQAEAKKETAEKAVGLGKSEAKSEKRQKERGTKENQEDALHYMKTLVEVARESFLILNSDLVVISANPIFYKTFDVKQGDTEHKILFKLGDGQWDIPELKELLEKVLPEKKDVKNFEVTHVFPSIGEKTMLLNASQIDSVQLIIIALEDISDRKLLQNKLAKHTEELEATVSKKTAAFAAQVKELEVLNQSMVGRELKMVELKKEIEELKKGAGGTTASAGSM